MSRAGSMAVILLCHLVGAAIGTSAAEPNGLVQLRPEWVETERGERFLRLGISPVFPLSNSILRLKFPDRLQVEPLTDPWKGSFRTVPADEGTLELQVDIGDLPSSGQLFIDFNLHAPGRGGVVTYIVEGELEDGRVISEPTGVMVGNPGSPGIVKHGAREFRLVPLPEDEQ